MTKSNHRRSENILHSAAYVVVCCLSIRLSRLCTVSKRVNFKPQTSFTFW